MKGEKNYIFVMGFCFQKLNVISLFEGSIVDVVLFREGDLVEIEFEEDFKLEVCFIEGK